MGGADSALYRGGEGGKGGVVLEGMGGVTAGKDRQGLCSCKNSIGNI